MIRLLLGAVALVQPATAMAHDADEQGEPSAKPAIVVRASGMLDNDFGDQSQAATFLTALDPGLGMRIENRLRDEAGITQFRRSDARSAHPTSQGITLRGLGGNASSRALVTLDGIPQADPFGGWVAWTAYDAINLGGIQISRGGGSGADGAGALAGTIALLSDMTDGATASLAYGSHNSWDSSASAGTSLGSGRVAVDGRYARGDGFAPIIASQRGLVDRAAPFEQGGVGLRTRIDAGGNSRVDISLRGFFDRRDRGFDYSQSKVDGVDASARFVHDPEGEIQAIALAYIQLRTFDTGFGSVTADRSSVSPALSQHVPATGLGARVELRPAIAGTNPLHLGMDWRRTVGRTSEDFLFTGLTPARHRDAGGTSDTLGGFAEWTSGSPANGLLWTGSGRLDHWWLGEGYRTERNIGGSIRSDDRFAARQGWEGSGRIGVRWSVGPVAFRAAAYREWRLPTLNELYRPFRVGPDATAANETLKPERLWGGEAGIEWQAEGTRLSATLFANRLNNAIANVTLGQGPGLFPGVGFVAAGATYSLRQNLDAITSKGVELSAEQSLGAIRLRATYAYVDARVDASGVAAALSGRRPAQIARHNGSASLSYDHGPVRSSTTLRYVGAQNEDDLGLQVLDDAVTIDAMLAWHISAPLSVEVRGENLFDALVPAAISSADVLERASPRTLWVGARLSF